jgi:predicted esterase
MVSKPDGDGGNFSNNLYILLNPFFNCFNYCFMRYAFLLTFLFIHCFVNAQLIPRPLPNSTGVGFYEFRPADYNTGETYKHPVIICLGGIGEGGDGINDLPNLLISAVPYMIANGATMRFSFEGITQSFVVLIPQKAAGTGAWENSYIDAMINYAAQDSRLDMNRIFLTGYSLGGAACWNYASSASQNANKIAGIVPVAPSGINSNLCSIATNKVAVWGIHGIEDSGATPPGNTIGAVTTLNACPSILIKAKMSIYNNGAHDPTVFTFRSADTSNKLHYPNIYQWMLKINKPLNQIANQPPTANAGQLNLTYDVPVKDKDILLDGIPSTDPDDFIAGYNWERLTPNPFPIDPSFGPTYFLSINNNGYNVGEFILGSDTSFPRPRTNISFRKNNFRALIDPGVYTYRLTVTDYKGATSSIVKTITVKLPSTGNPLPGAYIGDDYVLQTNETSKYFQAETKDWGGGYIVDHLWRQISGPQTVNINPNQYTATISNMTASGIYLIELVVTDNQGGIGKDTVAIIKPGAAVLPVTLTYFKGKNLDQKNILSWATSDETDNDRFEIQRSEDGINFSEVGRVAGKGNGNGITEYSFEDANAVKGVNYYRLKQVDKNGKFTFSAVITVTVSNKGYSIEQYPNPVQDVLTLRLEGNTYGNIQVSIADIQGRIVSRKTIRKEALVLKSELYIKQLQSGVYQLVIQFENGKKETRSFVKN